MILSGVSYGRREGRNHPRASFSLPKIVILNYPVHVVVLYKCYTTTRHWLVKINTICLFFQLLKGHYNKKKTKTYIHIRHYAYMYTIR